MRLAGRRSCWRWRRCRGRRSTTNTSPGGSAAIGGVGGAAGGALVGAAVGNPLLGAVAGGLGGAATGYAVKKNSSGE